MDKNGIPIWPEEDREKPWNLETKKLVVREFMTAHYGSFFYPLFVPQTNAGHSSSFGEIQAQMSLEEICKRLDSLY